MPRSLLSSSEEEYELSDAAAQLIRRDDDGGPLQVLVDTGPGAQERIHTGNLQRVVTLLETVADVTLLEIQDSPRRAQLIQRGLPPGPTSDCGLVRRAEEKLGVTDVEQAAALLRDIRWLDCPLPMSLLAIRFATMLQHLPVDALRESLGAPDDLGTKVKEAALAEPLLSVHSTNAESEYQADGDNFYAVGCSISQIMDCGIPDELNTLACLERCNALTLKRLKAVSACWRRRVYVMLGDAGAVWRRHPIWAESNEGRELKEALAAPRSNDHTVKTLKIMRRLDDVELPAYADAISEKVGDEDTRVRMAAVLTLAELHPAVMKEHTPAGLKEHAPDIIAVLGEVLRDILPYGAGVEWATEQEDEQGEEARHLIAAVLKMLTNLDSEAQAMYAPLFVTALEHSNPHARVTALETSLHLLDPAVWAKIAPAVFALVADTEMYYKEGCISMCRAGHIVQEEVRKTLGRLEPAELAEHAPAIVALLEVNDDDGEFYHGESHFEFCNGEFCYGEFYHGIRETALMMLEMLDAEVLAKYAPAIFALLEGPQAEPLLLDLEHFSLSATPFVGVREAAVQLLEEKLDPAVLAENVTRIVAKLMSELEHTDPAARWGVVWPLVSLARLDVQAVLADHTTAIAALLEDSDPYVRVVALETLSWLDSTKLADHRCAISALLGDSDPYVRVVALETLGILEPAVLAEHAPAIVARLKDSDSPECSAKQLKEDAHFTTVCETAATTLGKLDAAALAEHALAIVAILEHSDWKVPALKTLGNLDPVVLAGQAPVFVALMDRSDPTECVEALEILHKLDPAALTQHAPAIVAVLKKSAKGLREHDFARGFHGEDLREKNRRLISAAMGTLGRLDPTVLATQAPAIVAVLEDSYSSHYWGVCTATLCILCKLDPTVLAAHAPAIGALLDGCYDKSRKTSPKMHKAAKRALGKIDPAVLAEHAVAAHLNKDYKETWRDLALKYLGELAPAVLGEHATAIAALLKEDDEDDWDDEDSTSDSESGSDYERDGSADEEEADDYDDDDDEDNDDDQGPPPEAAPSAPRRSSRKQPAVSKKRSAPKPWNPRKMARKEPSQDGTQDGVDVCAGLYEGLDATRSVDTAYGGTLNLCDDYTSKKRRLDVSEEYYNVNRDNSRIDSAWGTASTRRNYSAAWAAAAAESDSDSEDED
jgi:hypothetical protein